MTVKLCDWKPNPEKFIALVMYNKKIPPIFDLSQRGNNLGQKHIFLADSSLSECRAVYNGCLCRIRCKLIINIWIKGFTHKLFTLAQNIQPSSSVIKWILYFRPNKTFCKVIFCELPNYVVISLATPYVVQHTELYCNFLQCMLHAIEQWPIM